MSGLEDKAFLTLEDPNVKIRGSRDPLGMQPVWARFARQVVANLTTQSTSVRGFTIFLLGRYFGKRLSDEGIVGREDFLDVFLRMEQLGAYARHVGHGVGGDIRGIERVRTRVAEGGGKVSIQVDRHGLILSDQKIYGLWGLYSVPARVSGLIPDGQLGIEPEAQDFLEKHYLPHLNKVRGPLFKLLSHGGKLKLQESDVVFAALKKVLPEKFSPDEVAFYGEHLRDGAKIKTAVAGRQARFARLLEQETELDEPIGSKELWKLVKASAKKDEGLSRSLSRIGHLEALLAPAGVLFDYVRTKQGTSPEALAKNLNEYWGGPVPSLSADAFRELKLEISQSSSEEIATAMQHCHDALHSGDYREALTAVIRWNELVMAARNSAPWVSMKEGKINVRYRGIERLLPKRDELGSLWHNSYFIDSLKSVIRQLRKTA